MASIVFSNFNDFVQRCKETVVSNINWEAMILKVLSGNSEFIVNQVPLTTDDSQKEANPSMSSESTTSSFEMPFSQNSEENLDHKFEAQLYDIKYNQTDILSTIDEREEKAEVQETSHDYHSSQSLIRNEEIRPLVQEEEKPLEQLNKSLHWDFLSSKIENQDHSENLEECSVSLMEDITYVVPEMEICEEDPIGQESAPKKFSLPNMNVKVRELNSNGFSSDHSTVDEEIQDHKDYTPVKTMKKFSRRRPYNNKKGHLKDNMGNWCRKSIEKRKIGEVMQADMNKAPHKKLRMNFTDVEKTREVPQVQQVQPYVLLPRLSKVDVLRTVRLLRQRTFSSLNADKSRCTESFRCNICHQLLKNKYGLLRHHIYRHTDEKPYKCPHCPKSFKNYGDVKQHTRRIHTISRSYNTTPSTSISDNFNGEKKRKVLQEEEAEYCPPTSYYSEEVDPQKTVRSLRPKNSISVNYAEDSTVTRSKKLEDQTDDGSKNHWIDRRGRNVVSLVSNEKKSAGKVEETERQKNELASELEEQENIISNNNGSSSAEGCYCCDICHLWLKHKKSLWRHIVYQHIGESKPFKCPHCPRSYTDSTALKKHLQTRGHRDIGS